MFWISLEKIKKIVDKLGLHMVQGHDDGYRIYHKMTVNNLLMGWADYNCELGELEIANFTVDKNNNVYAPQLITLWGIDYVANRGNPCLTIYQKTKYFVRLEKRLKHAIKVCDNYELNVKKIQIKNKMKKMNEDFE